MSGIVIEHRFGLAKSKPLAMPPDGVARFGSPLDRAASCSDYAPHLILDDVDDLDGLRAARGICKWTAICLSVEVAIVLGLIFIRMVSQ